MQNLLFHLSFAFLLLLASSFFNQALATTGGPTILEDFKYDVAENKAYYFQADAGGAGFQPSLIQYDPSIKKFSTVFVDEFLFTRLSEEKQKAIRFTSLKEAKEFLATLEPLPRINLAKNNVTVEVFLSKEYDLEYRGNIWGFLVAELTARVLQDGEEVGNASFYDCGKSVAFEGFVVPGSNQLLLLTNSIGQCFETGYTVDRLFPITEIVLVDSTFLPELKDYREWEGSKGPGLSEKSLVVAPDIELEERYAVLRSFANDAYQDGELKPAAEYLKTVWVHCCFYQEVEEDKKDEYYPIAFELAAIQSERGEISGYMNAVSILENLLAREDDETNEFYKQKILADARFEQLRNDLSERDFNELFKVSKETEDIGETEVLQEIEEEGGEKSLDRSEEKDVGEAREKDSNVLPLTLAGLFLMIITGAVALRFRRNLG